MRATPRLKTLGAIALCQFASACVMAPPVYREHRPAPVTQYAAPPEPPANAMYFYPERGQPEVQQDRDRYECYRWSVRETGFDPGMTPVHQGTPAPLYRNPRDGAEVVGGAATGAVLGAALSGPRHAGQHAIIGAVFGALVGAASQESRAQAIDNANARREAQWEAAQQPTNNFRRAMRACMSGRGYRIG